MLLNDIKMENPAHRVDREFALSLSTLEGNKIYELFNIANKLRIKFRGNKIDLCSIVNAKAGACPEDCSFCAQSAHNSTTVEIYPLIEKEMILKAASSAKENRAKRFCIVTSGRRPSENELDDICSAVSGIRRLGLLPCATLGILDEPQLRRLKDAGLNRYHHNLETSEAFFPEICTTHTYREKLKTINIARSIGLSVCSGGIFGLGESWEDRIEMALAIRDTEADSVPINFFTPISGTPSDERENLNPMEALKIIAIYRLILPDREIRICGGRGTTLRDLSSHIFLAGADGFLIGNYLTVPGRSPADDIKMIEDMELEI